MRDKALALLHSRAASATAERAGGTGTALTFGGWGSYGPTEPLVLAALVEDPAQGWQSLEAFLNETDQKLDVNYQVGVLGTLYRLSKPADKDNPRTQVNAFQVDAEIAKTVPQVAANGNDLTKAFVALANRYQPDPKQQYHFAFSGVFYHLPNGTKDEALIGALEGLKSKATGHSAQWIKPQIDQAIAKVRGDEVAVRNRTLQQAPVAPPKPNDEF